MLKVGITGNIGSGKSTVCRIFELLGIHVYYADERSRLLMHEPAVIQKIVSLFGEDLLNEEKKIDRKKLAVVVFNDPEKLKQLENIIHPATLQDFDQWCESYKQEAYILKEAAILFESKTYPGLHKIITVSAPEDIRIQRVISRDHVTEDMVLQRVRSQWSDEEKMKRADFIIYNDGRQLLIPQVVDIHNSLLILAKS